jgi:hypothetical protein
MGLRSTSWPASLLRAAQQLVDPRFVLLRSILDKDQLRRAAQMQALGQLPSNVPARSLQSFHGRGRRGIVSLDHDHDAGGARIGSEKHLAHIRQSNARISEFPLENGFDLFAQGFPQSFPMVLLTAPFQLNHLKVKRMRISEIALPGGMWQGQSKDKF